MNWSSTTARLAFQARQAAARETWTAASNGSLAVAVFRRPQRLLGSTGSTSSSSCSSDHGIAGTARATAGYTCILRTLTGKLESPRRAPNARMTRSSLLGATSAMHWTATPHHFRLQRQGIRSQRRRQNLPSPPVSNTLPSCLSHQDDKVEFTHQNAQNHSLPA